MSCCFTSYSPVITCIWAASCAGYIGFQASPPGTAGNMLYSQPECLRLLLLPANGSLNKLESRIQESNSLQFPRGKANELL